MCFSLGMAVSMWNAQHSLDESVSPKSRWLSRIGILYRKWWKKEKHFFDEGGKRRRFLQEFQKLRKAVNFVLHGNTGQRGSRRG